MLSGGPWLSVLIVLKAPFAAEHALRFHWRPVCQTRCLGFEPCAVASVDFDAGHEEGQRLYRWPRAIWQQPCDFREDRSLTNRMVSRPVQWSLRAPRRSAWFDLCSLSRRAPRRSSWFDLCSLSPSELPVSLEGKEISSSQSEGELWCPSDAELIRCILATLPHPSPPPQQEDGGSKPAPRPWLNVDETNRWIGPNFVQHPSLFGTLRTSKHLLRNVDFYGFL